MEKKIKIKRQVFVVRTMSQLDVVFVLLDSFFFFDK